MRSQQQATWNNIRASLLADEAKYEQELKRAEQQRRDRLHYDTNFVTPEYAKFEIHLQPGGYVADTLAGYVFHHGTKVFYQGQNDQDELHHLVASMAREPNNGKVQRILDIGCSIGQGTTALKQRFPRAEVWGLDVALPLLRYGHKRAIDLGIDVHFKQALAEASGFPDDFFDVVLAHILFHEVPSMLFRPIVDEVRRVLRPGGTFTVVDAPKAAALPASNRMWQQYDSIYNCEPYALDFVATDLPTLLGDAGFEFLHQGPTPTFLWCSQAAKPT
jgi:ubiquinone/menaquinone biosynthesis C-methylase UbiE